jgi:hypothetical protein
MPRFLVDEDLPRSLAQALRAAGYDATDVLVHAIVAAVASLAGEQLAGTIVIIEPGRLRIRRSAAR